MSAHVFPRSSASAPRRRDVRRRLRRAAVYGLLPRLRMPPAAMRPGAGEVIFA